MLLEVISKFIDGNTGSCVIPAKAGIQFSNLLLKIKLPAWIPACAGMTTFRGNILRSLLASLFIFPLFSQGAIPLQSGTSEEIVAAIEETVSKNSRDKATVASLIHALDSTNSDVRVKERAAWALGQIKAESALKALAKAAEHKGLLIRSAAINSLIRIRSNAALPILIKTAMSDPVLAVRQRAVSGLGLLRSTKAIEPLVQLSSDEREEIKGAAVLSMSALHSSKNNFSEILGEMEKDPSVYVQERAKTALILAKGKAAQVAPLFSSDDSDIRLFAALYFTAKGKTSDLKTLKAFQNSEANEEVQDEIQTAVKSIQRRAKAAADKKKKQALKPKAPPPH